MTGRKLCVRCASGVVLGLTVHQIGVRYGHFYAYTLVDSLSPKIDVDDAVVRISLVHYNTVEEVQKIIEIMEEVLA